jgi:hypothetical protein
VTRTLLVLACVAFFVLCVIGMRVGWVHRGRRQLDLPAPADPPAELSTPRLPALTGLYVGTTTAERWQDRIVAGGLGVRADATVSLHDEGLLIERSGSSAVFIPRDAIIGAGLGSGLAGKVVGAGGLLIVRWRLGEADVDTGVRADDKTVYPDWVRAIDNIQEAA